MTVGAAARGPHVIDRLVAIVADRAITLSDVRAAIELGLVPQADVAAGDASVVRRLVDRALVAIEVERYGPGAPDEALVSQRVQEMEQALGAAGFAAAMARAGLDGPRLRALVREDLSIERYLGDRFGAAAEPTDDEVAQYARAGESERAQPGRVPPAGLEGEARAALTALRRQKLIDEWIESLRRRARITVMWPPAAGR
jgi:hypothetical protein